MSQNLKTTSVRLDAELAKNLDELSVRYHMTKNEIVEEALKYFIEEMEDLESALKILNDPTTEYIDWETVEDELLRQN